MGIAAATLHATFMIEDEKMTREKLANSAGISSATLP